ncbi:putative bifunctional diguanylate cyclase/phosphodiesterase [Methylobacterium iners]|nr:EAL domain-containing protein [Methylobacterium iners]
MKTFFRLFAVTPSEPKLLVAQATALTRQVPVLYAILGVNTLALGVTQYGIAPDWLVLYPLVVLLPVCLIRAITWARRTKLELKPDEALKRLQVTNRLTAILCVAVAGWGVVLWSYNAPSSKTQIIFFLAVTMISCIFCLVHLRSATLIIGAVALPLAIYFVMVGHVIVTAMALNFLAVVAAMMFMQNVFYRDFRNLVQISDENKRLANLDMLTELPNRRCFFSGLAAKIEQHALTGTPFTIAMIDLDGFKPVNDTYGHQAGDEVLREVGRRLSSTMEGIGWAARLGGDEFGLIFHDVADERGFGHALCHTLSRPYVLRNTTAEVRASIGLAIYPTTADTPEQLVERADYALYFAKSHHRGTAILFTAQHETDLRSQSLIEQTLRHADLEAEFELVYQPIMDVTSTKVVAFEALARWDSPHLGRVSPMDFIPVAERSGLIQELTRSLFAKALSALEGWPEDVALSFNLSTCDIAAPAAMAQMAGLITSSGVRPERILFEVTETALMRDCADARQSLMSLKALNIAIAIDDFGNGYSSLSYVHKLPLDKLKIDRSFIADVATDQACRDIVRSIVDLCRNLRIACIVEGVETQEQMLVLRSLGCLFMQGYLFSRPMPLAEVAAFLKACDQSDPLHRGDQLTSAA